MPCRTDEGLPYEHYSLLKHVLTELGLPGDEPSYNSENTAIACSKLSVMSIEEIESLSEKTQNWWKKHKRSDQILSGKSSGFYWMFEDFDGEPFIFHSKEVAETAAMSLGFDKLDVYKWYPPEIYYTFEHFQSKNQDYAELMKENSKLIRKKKILESISPEDRALFE